jgi:hypothetical protein
MNPLTQGDIMTTIQKIAVALYFAFISGVITFSIKRIRNERAKQKKIDAAWANFKAGNFEINFKTAAE